MKENPSEHKTSDTVTFRPALPQEMITNCPKCGGELGLWSEGEETACVFCDQRIFDREATEH